MILDETKQTLNKKCAKDIINKYYRYCVKINSLQGAVLLAEILANVSILAIFIESVLSYKINIFHL